MNYILTEDELNQMTNKSEVVRRDNTLLKARAVILTHTGFHCIHTHEGRHGKCDDCPCSYNKHATFTYEQSQLICNLQREYSK